MALGAPFCVPLEGALVCGNPLRSLCVGERGRGRRGGHLESSQPPAHSGSDGEESHSYDGLRHIDLDIDLLTHDSVFSVSDRVH